MNRKWILAILIVAGVVFLLVGYGRIRKSAERTLVFHGPIFGGAVSAAGLSDLHIAVIQNDMSTIEKLVNNGVDVNLRDINGGTALHLACFFGKVEAAEFLMSKGANLNAQDNKGYTPLISAVIGGQVEIVKSLLSHGAKSDIRDKNGQTALEIAVRCKENMRPENVLSKFFLSGYNRSYDKCIQILSKQKESR